MSSRKRQRGITLWQLIYVLGTLGFIVMVLIKCAPVYMNEMSVKRAVHDVAAKTSVTDGQVDAQAIRSDLNRRWDIDYISKLDWKDVKVTRTASGVKLVYDYEAREHLFGNVFIVMHFADEVPIRGAAGTGNAG